ncbi:hypothetical protein BDA99DRAFT_543878 [Phascolomyces articulosus]|uniref:Uncharacterized protein n=1 Tax=Phascolomyces articulosus TaxID=60185 RepID=A0AAD5P7C4_9FUNG|nr:hypothetical protein BDA99DRAFT_543878 [Phascolomyces articulosus]
MLLYLIIFLASLTPLLLCSLPEYKRNSQVHVILTNSINEDQVSSQIQSLAQRHGCMYVRVKEPVASVVFPLTTLDQLDVLQYVLSFGKMFDDLEIPSVPSTLQHYISQKWCQAEGVIIDKKSSGLIKFLTVVHL